MVDVISQIIIKKPLEVVAKYASNPDNAPMWYTNIKSAEWQTPKPLKKGTKVAFTACFLSTSLKYIYEFTDIQPNQKLIMRTAQGPFPMETIYGWKEIDPNTTLMSIQNIGEPKGFSKLFAPFMAFMVRRAINKDLKNIKRIVENYE
jgi:mRNA-degrading endonuclease HigB of HigAB toxin-antitoxin module